MASSRRTTFGELRKLTTLTCYEHSYEVLRRAELEVERAQQQLRTAQQHRQRAFEEYATARRELTARHRHVSTTKTSRCDSTVQCEAATRMDIGIQVDDHDNELLTTGSVKFKCHVNMCDNNKEAAVCNTASAPHRPLGDALVTSPVLSVQPVTSPVAVTSPSQLMTSIQLSVSENSSPRTLRTRTRETLKYSDDSDTNEMSPSDATTNGQWINYVEECQRESNNTDIPTTCNSASDGGEMFANVTSPLVVQQRKSCGVKVSAIVKKNSKERRKATARRISFEEQIALYRQRSRDRTRRWRERKKLMEAQQMKQPQQVVLVQTHQPLFHEIWMKTDTGKEDQENCTVQPESDIKEEVIIPDQSDFTDYG